MLSSLSNDPDFKPLSLIDDNYTYWSKRVLSVLKLQDLGDYVLNKIASPTDPAAYWLYMSNHKKIIAFLEQNVADSEKEFLETEDSATAWSNLIKRHQQRGPITQIRLIQELFSIEFTSDITALPAALDRARHLTDRIYAQSIPTADTMCLVSILGALEKNFDNIRSDATSHYISNPTDGLQWLVNRISEEVLFKAPKLSTDRAAEIALFMTLICGNCKRKGHKTELCYQPGGKMEGKKAEVEKGIADKRATAGGNAARNKRGGNTTVDLTPLIIIITASAVKLLLIITSYRWAHN